MPEIINKEVKATGPICKYGVEAKSAYTINGTRPAYNPYCGGKPAR